jgi:PAS domain S-box-containing protein
MEDVSKTMNKPRKLKLLLVEDSDVDAELLTGYLERSGYCVEYQRVSSPATMEQALEKQSWDLVLCDYWLPGFGVIHALDLIRQYRLDIPFIVVSGAAGESLAVEVMKAGAHDYIMKDSLARLAPAIERELREAEARAERLAATEKLLYLAAIVDSSGEAIIGQNLNGVITTWNTGAGQLYGYTEAEVLGQSITMLASPTSQSSLLEIFEQLRAGNAVEHIEMAHVCKDGTPLDVSLTISPVKSAEGRVMGAAAIVYDITERKKIADERAKMIEELNETLSKVKALSGLLPICASCKNIRDDHGYWQKLETFVREHSNAEFSHSICPECMEKLYPQFCKPNDNQQSN